MTKESVVKKRSGVKKKSAPQWSVECLTLGEAADMLYEKRKERMEAQKVVDTIKKCEAELTTYIINNLSKEDAEGVSGKIARVNVTVDAIPTVEDWEKFYSFIHEKRMFALLQKRVSPAAVKDMWNDDVEVPGVGVFNKVGVSCVKK